MKTLAIQFIFCLLLSNMLHAMPILQDTSKNRILGTIIDKNVTIVKDTIKEKAIITISIDDDDDDDDYDNNRFRDNIRVGMLDFGISSYVADDGGLDLPDELDILDQVLWRSINVGLHIVNIKAGFGSRNKAQKFGISTGIKINWVHYSFEKDFSLERNAPDFESALNFNVPELRKNRLRGTYLQIPVLLEFNSNPRNRKQSLNLGIGYVHQFLLGSQFRYRTTEGDKFRTRGDFNLRRSMGMIEGRVGIGNLNFFLQYGLRDLFQTGDGPEVTPINFGINLIPR